MFIESDIENLDLLYDHINGLNVELSYNSLKNGLLAKVDVVYILYTLQLDDIFIPLKDIDFISEFNVSIYENIIYKILPKLFEDPNSKEAEDLEVELFYSNLNFKYNNFEIKDNKFISNKKIKFTIFSINNKYNNLEIMLQDKISFIIKSTIDGLLDEQFYFEIPKSDIDNHLLSNELLKIIQENAKNILIDIYHYDDLIQNEIKNNFSSISEVVLFSEDEFNSLFHIETFSIDLLIERKENNLNLSGNLISNSINKHFNLKNTLNLDNFKNRVFFENTMKNYVLNYFSELGIDSANIHWNIRFKDFEFSINTLAPQSKNYFYFSELQNVFAKNLKKLRNERNLTQEALAEIVACDKQSIQCIETLKRSPSFELISKLSQALEVDLYYLFTS